MEEKKEKILSRCNVIPIKNIVKYLRDGVITMDELRAKGLSSEREDEINKEIVSNENIIWTRVSKSHTPQAYHEYLRVFLTIASKHLKIWRKVGGMSFQSLQQKSL